MVHNFGKKFFFEKNILGNVVGVPNLSKSLAVALNCITRFGFWSKKTTYGALNNTENPIYCGLKKCSQFLIRQGSESVPSLLVLLTGLRLCAAPESTQSYQVKRLYELCTLFYFSDPLYCETTRPLGLQRRGP